MALGFGIPFFAVIQAFDATPFADGRHQRVVYRPRDGFDCICHALLSAQLSSCLRHGNGHPPAIRLFFRFMNPDDDIPDWDGTTADARALQQSLPARVVLRDGFPKPLSMVAGFDIVVDGSSTSTAAVVLLDAVELSIVESHVVSVATPDMQDVGLHSFREVAALLAAFRMLAAVPDMALIDGHGIAHPQRFGVASHFGVATGIPTIGVATTALIGAASPLHQIRGAYTPLRDQGKQIGWLLRTQAREEPLVVSPGHKVAMASTADLVMRFVTRHRLPEPLRLAGQLLPRSTAIGSQDAESE